jgi:hypothetical protein
MFFNISNTIMSLLNLQKRIDIKKLPSQGLFYKDDFEILIKKASIEDIIIYEKNFIKDDIGSIINEVKSIVRKNTIFKNEWTFDDIKSVDIVFIFFEIVKFTKAESIVIPYLNDYNIENIKFEYSNFNYHELDSSILEKYDNENKEFVIDGYRLSLPTIGSENSVTSFLIEKAKENNLELYNNYFYEFTYFIGHRNKLSFNEIENLIQVFNFDLDSEEIYKIEKIIEIFKPLQKYSLKKGDKIIDINSKINLEKIWK